LRHAARAADVDSLAWKLQAAEGSFTVNRDGEAGKGKMFFCLRKKAGKRQRTESKYQAGLGVKACIVVCAKGCRPVKSGVNSGYAAAGPRTCRAAFLSKEGWRRSIFLIILAVFGPLGIYHGEFDPGSERTLAACLKHASRAARAAMPLERRTGE
jgi:hypothetical protein